jgi:hypothetical protein
MAGFRTNLSSSLLYHPDYVHAFIVYRTDFSGHVHRYMLPFRQQGNDLASPELDHEHFMVVFVPVMVAAMLVVMIVAFIGPWFRMDLR